MKTIFETESMQIQEWMPGVDLKVFLGGVHNLGMAQLTANGEIKSWNSLLSKNRYPNTVTVMVSMFDE